MWSFLHNIHYYCIFLKPDYRKYGNLLLQACELKQVAVPYYQEQKYKKRRTGGA